MFPGRKKRIMTFFNARFGKDPTDSAEALRCRDRLPQVRILDETLSGTAEEDPYAVDEIAWTDLEMDEVFLRINQTGSYIGEQVLYHILHNGSATIASIPDGAGKATHWRCCGHSASRMRSYRMQMKQ